MRRTWQPAALAAVCLAAAAVLGVLALQLVRWPEQMDRSDAIFRAQPERADLWRVSNAPPLDPVPGLLGFDDDIAFRRALQLFWLAKPRPPTQYRANESVLVAQAQSVLGRIAASDPEPARRSIALNLLGVLQLDDVFPTDPNVLSLYLRQGIADFANAVRLDPSNLDAKANLELALLTTKQKLDALPIGKGPGGAAGEGSGGGVGFVGGTGY